MNEETLRRFMLGRVNEAEEQLCEQILADQETVINELDANENDSLIKALSDPSTNLREETRDAQRLVERIEQLIEPRTFRPEEWNRVLEEPLQEGDLGSIGRYRIVEFIASGGMGVVFRAIDSQLDRVVCIKLLNPAHQFNLETKTRFLRESREAAKLVHDRIVSIVDVGECNGLPWFTMPMHDGMTLRKRLQQSGVLPTATALGFLRQIAEGLNFAHRHGLLHRDLKPDNIWITDSGAIKILDFGLARPAESSGPLTHSGTLIGTPSYMSPEQVAGKPLDERSDLFSMGVLLIEMLTGRSPFLRSNLISTMMSVANEQIDLVKLDPERRIPAGVREFAEDLLQIDVSKRIKSADVLLERIEQVSEHPDKLQRPTWGHSRWWPIVASGFFGAILCLGGVAIWIAGDKGTLVVETNDPNVEVNIKGSSVTVRDPVTDRVFNIQIGATPLPTGVYRLEVTDPNSDLVFSSDTFTIRRGKKAIVDVSLKQASLGKNTPEDVSPAPVVAADTWADPSYDPIARDRFGDVLGTIPSRPIMESNLSRTPLSDNAIVSQPIELPGISSWSVEALSNGSGKISNCDRSLDAEILKTGFVQISDKDGIVKHMLPIRGAGWTAHFDHKYPNLIGVISSNMKLPLSIETVTVPPPNNSEIALWRLSDKKAELLFRLSTSKPEFDWDDGYRVAYWNENKLNFFRLDLDKSFTINDVIMESILKNGISPDGRYIATYSTSGNSYQVNIFDLKENRFDFSIQDSNSCQWKADSTEIATITNDGFLIWQIDDHKDAKRVDAPKTIIRDGGGGGGGRGGPGGAMEARPAYSVNALERNFERVAFLSEIGELTIRSLKNNRQNSLQLFTREKGAEKQFRANLYWEPGGTLLIRLADKTLRWTPILSNVHGEIAEISGPAKRSEPEKFRPTASAVMAAKNAGIVFSRKSGYDEQSSTTWLQKFRVDLSEGAGTTCNVKGDLNPSNVSPNGNFYFDPPRRNTVVSDDKLSNIVDLKTGTKNKIEGFVTRVQDVRERGSWSHDGRYLVIPMVNMPPASRSECVVFDSLNNKFKDLERIDDRSQIYVVFALRDKQFTKIESKFWEIDASKGIATSATLFDSFPDFRLLDDKNGYVYFTNQEQSRNLSRNVLSSVVSVIYRAKIVENTFTEIESVEIPGLLQMSVSPDAQFVLLYQRLDTDQISICRWSDLLQKNSKAMFRRNDITNAPFDIAWHPDKNVATWNDYRTTYFFDATSIDPANNSRTVPFPKVVPAEFGWLAANGHAICALDIDCKPLGQFVFPPYVVEGESTNPRWISADGRILKGGDTTDLFFVMCKNNEVQTIPLAEYLSDANNPFPERIEKISLGAVSR